MATVTDVVKGALLLLEVVDSESALTATEASDGLNSLNDMMNEWNVNGINVGYETLDDTSDELYVTLGSIGAIKANLAVYIAPEYGRVVSQSLFERAKTSKRSLRGSIALNPAQFPDTLPVGSGNEDSNYHPDGDSPGTNYDYRFYRTNNTTQCN